MVNNVHPLNMKLDVHSMNELTKVVQASGVHGPHPANGG